MFQNPTVNLNALCSSCATVAYSFAWVDLHVVLCG